VRLSSDGVPVLVHDAHFRRFGMPFPVRMTRAAVLKRHGIPSLSDLYEVLGTRFELSVDVKVRDAARPAIDVAREFGALRTLWLVHSDPDALQSWRAYDDDVRLVHEAEPPASRDDAVQAARERAGVLQRFRIDAENRHWGSWDASQVAVTHERGVLAFGSLVHRPDEIPDAASRSLDALYSDHVAALVAALGGTGT
jgi:hypothetical protein